MTKHPDYEQVKLLLDGDKRAFEAFFNAYFQRLFRFARMRLQNDDSLAEEAVQAAMGKALEKLESYRAEASLYSWLCTFCRYEVSAIIRREQRFNSLYCAELTEDDPDIERALEQLSLSSAKDPMSRYELAETLRMVSVALDQLPTVYGDVLEWKYLHGYSVKEIAAKISRTPKATESTLTRARVAFRETFSVLIEGGSAQALDYERMS